MIEINLIPAKFKKARKMQMFIFAGAAAGIMVLVVLLGLVWAQNQKIAGVEREIRKVDAESAALADKIEEVKKFRAMEEILQKKSALLTSLLKEQSFWPRLLDRIALLVPKGMRLTTLAHESEKDDGMIIRVTGNTASKSILADFIGGLENTQNIMDIKTVMIGEQYIGSSNMIIFDITFLYKKDKK